MEGTQGFSIIHFPSGFCNLIFLSPGTSCSTVPQRSLFLTEFPRPSTHLLSRMSQDGPYSCISHTLSGLFKGTTRFQKPYTRERQTVIIKTALFESFFNVLKRVLHILSQVPLRAPRHCSIDLPIIHHCALSHALHERQKDKEDPAAAQQELTEY